MDRDDFFRLENKIDKLDSRLDKIDITLAKQHEQIAIHIKRSDLLEQQVEPIKTQVAMVSGAMKLLGLLAIITAIGESIIKAIDFIKDLK